MGKYKELFNKYENGKENEPDAELEKELENAGSYEDKADILLNNKLDSMNGQFVLLILCIIIIGNIVIKPPMIFHSYGHFGLILHPIYTLKECFFNWGENNNSFIFSLTGIRHYLTVIPYVYHKYGALNATFMYLTQFSPLWGWLPAQLLIKGCLEAIQESVYSEKTDLIKFLKDADKASDSNE